VLYVLDEPTIGLHPRDNVKLLDALQSLQKTGNSLLIVEHDEETMQRADTIIDLGPGAGRLGGEIIAQGSLPQVKRQKKSITGRTLANPIQHPIRGKRRSLPKIASKTHWMRLEGCQTNNLKNISAKFPVGRLTVITGVSGGGKSSLMRGSLLPAAEKALGKKGTYTKGIWKKQQGFESIKSVFEMDQSPIGKTSRSCPATYVKIFDEIRKVFAQLPEARARGYNAGRFSFNNEEGRCPECKGNGRIKLEMDFLASTWVPCETCNQARYNQQTLEVLYSGKSIADVLAMTIDEAADFFASHPKLAKTLNLLRDTGLGYLQLGQPSPTLSGGEAQRLKLVTELTKGRSPKAALTTEKLLKRNLYLIEEPTIGLHPEDVRKLIEVLF